MIEKIKTFFKEHTTIIFLLASVFLIYYVINFMSVSNFNTDIEFDYPEIIQEDFEQRDNYLDTFSKTLLAFNQYNSLCLKTYKNNNIIYYEVLLDDSLIYNKKYQTEIETKLKAINIGIDSIWSINNFDNIKSYIILLDPKDYEIYLISTFNGNINYSIYNKIK